MFKRIEFVFETIGAISVVVLCVLIVAIVICREFFGFGVPDGIIIVRELMVLAILFPLSAATAKRAHVSIEVIANLFPDALNRWIAVFAALVGVVLVTALLLGGWEQFTKAFESGSHHGGDLFIPKWISRGAFVLAFGFVLLRMLNIFWVDLRAAVLGLPAAMNP
ncbi:MAG: TRAP transporter small permease [Cohaesibacteraceae bacterium]